MELLGKNKGTLTDFKDPFSKDKVSGITIFIRKGLFDSALVHEAYVDFKNGNTSGRQEFKASSFADLVNQVDLFIEDL